MHRAITPRCHPVALKFIIASMASPAKVVVTTLAAPLKINIQGHIVDTPALGKR